MCDVLNPVKGAKWLRKQFTPDMPSARELAGPRPENLAGAEAGQTAAMEARLRRRRAGAAANVLTSPLGIPAGSSPTLGGGA